MPNSIHIYNDQYKGAIIMGIFGLGLIIFFIWFTSIVKNTPLEMTCYIGIFVGFILLALSIYTHYRSKPVLSFDDNGIRFYILSREILNIPRSDIQDIVYSERNWNDIPNTITMQIKLKNNTLKTFGLRTSLIYDNRQIRPVEVYAMLKSKLINTY